MWFNSLRGSWKPGLSRRRREEPRPPRRGTRLALEQLETRLTLSLSALASFNGTNGTGPTGALIMDSSGNLYGTADVGGASNDGTVFEVVHGSGKITTLASFDGTDGADPYGALVMDRSGNLYGTASSGGASGDGTVFELAHGSGTITALASFDGPDGAFPRAGVIMDSSSNLYGTTNQGGAYGYQGGGHGGGTVFELAHGSGTITTLASFDLTDGAFPWSGVIMDSSGNLYGTSGARGLYNHGTVFELAHGSGTITTLFSFNGTDGAFPRAGVIMDGSGNLYGTTNMGGAAGYGAVFELAQANHRFTTLASFDFTDGAFPWAGLIVDSGGNFYGTASEGGASSEGTVFELVHGSGTITTLASFNGSNGANPYAGLIMDGSGNLYGMATAGGASSDGTVFELTGADVQTGQRTGASSAVNIHLSGDADASRGIPTYRGKTTDLGALTATTAGGNLAWTGPGLVTNTGTTNQFFGNSLLLENVAAVSLADDGIITAQGWVKPRAKP